MTDPSLGAIMSERRNLAYQLTGSLADAEDVVQETYARWYAQPEPLPAAADPADPAERVTFVLHDVFRYPFAEVAAIVGRSPAACRQLASSARRRRRPPAPSSRSPSPCPTSPSSNGR